MPWFAVEAEVTVLKKVTYVVKADDKHRAMDYVDAADPNRVVIESNSEIIDHIETRAIDVTELD